jgi:hypothetical protein
LKPRLSLSVDYHPPTFPAPHADSAGQSDYHWVPPQQAFRIEPSLTERFLQHVDNAQNINLLNVVQVVALDAMGKEHEAYIQETAPLTDSLLAMGGAYYVRAESQAKQSSTGPPIQRSSQETQAANDARFSGELNDVDAECRIGARQRFTRLAAGGPVAYV